MKSIVSKEMIGLVFKSKNGDDSVIVYGIINYALSSKELFTFSENTKFWAKEKGENFLDVRFKSIIDNTHKSMPLESFFDNYELATQKLDKTKWID